MDNFKSTADMHGNAIRLLIHFLIVGWCLMFIYPIASIILWSIILAMALSLLHRSLVKLMSGKPGITW